MEEIGMCLGCLFVLFATGFPRIGLILVWAFTNWVEIAFATWVWPLLGLVFLPLTTLLYVLVEVATVGDITLGGWLLIGLGALLDIAHWTQMFANRQHGVTLYYQYRPGGGGVI
jgi:hypothetical protein